MRAFSIFPAIPPFPHNVLGPQNTPSVRWSPHVRRARCWVFLLFLIHQFEYSFLQALLILFQVIFRYHLLHHPLSLKHAKQHACSYNPCRSRSRASRRCSVRGLVTRPCVSALSRANLRLLPPSKSPTKAMRKMRIHVCRYINYSSQDCSISLTNSARCMEYHL